MAQLLVLHGCRDVRGDVGEVGEHLVALVADDDHEMFGFEGLGRVNRVAEHGSTCHLVEQLGGLGLHARPATCCEDHDR